ncbi:MAG: glutamine-hydrolyzing carbamoyl-phosphate synthase small subunit [Deltaproteobacteria bacterium]|nr:glutamine-hydrolyzing carbamoyl-phosphate synthase small subunit [Deltaproteobacteria bacterium]
MKPAWLILRDGTTFEGHSFGAAGEVAGEVVFNTSMTGYQEVLTDPSYAGQIVAMTSVHIGNVGVNPEDVESVRPYLRGFVVRDYCAHPSNWRATLPLHHYLIQHDIVAVTGIDTRALTRHLREDGTMPGIVTTRAQDLTGLVARARVVPAMDGQDLVETVTCRKPYEWEETTHPLMTDAQPDREIGQGLHIVVYDFGVKLNILRSLVACGAKVTVVPAATPAADALARRPDGVLLSNGPGDPAAVTGGIASVRGLIGRVPLFGICLGHQILGLALGGRTFKLKFGHRGANQPVKDMRTGRVAITAQNHGFAVDPDSLPSNVAITHYHLNDQTVEGLVSTSDPVFSCQYHPEASPGPHDTHNLFGEFLTLCRSGQTSSRS